MFSLRRRRYLIRLKESRSAWKKKTSVDAPEMSLLEWFHKDPFYFFFLNLSSTKQEFSEEALSKLKIKT